MLSGKERLNQMNFVDTSLLLDAVTSLIDAFKQAGYNPPLTIQVDKKAFDKLLEEASTLYSSINIKDSIANQEFSIANIINIVFEGGKQEADNQNKLCFLQAQNNIQQQVKAKTKDENQEKQQPSLSATTTKYECTDCDATFYTPAGHRKHSQAFHGRIEEPKVIEQAEI
jgi:hypothetical protein